MRTPDLARGRPMTPPADSYLRFSSPQQATGDSVRRQTENRERWLAANPAVKLDTLLRMTDAGHSGRRGRRPPVLEELLAPGGQRVGRGNVSVPAQRRDVPGNRVRPVIPAPVSGRGRLAGWPTALAWGCGRGRARPVR